MKAVLNLAVNYVLSMGSVSNYFRLSVFAIYNCIYEQEPMLIRWPETPELESMEGLIVGVPNCAFLLTLLRLGCGDL